MKSIKIIITISLLSIFIVSAKAQIQVIPRPQQVTMQDGAYILSSKTVVVSRKLLFWLIFWKILLEREQR